MSRDRSASHDSPPAPTRVDRRKERTRQAVITAAMGLILRHGFDAVTMEQIAEAADVAKGTLYAYFPVKEAIIAAWLDQESLARNAERAARLRGLASTRARLHASLAELVEAIGKQRDIFERYFTYRTQQMVSLRRDDHPSGIRLLEGEIIRMGQETGELRTDLPFEMLEALFEFTFVVLAQRFYQDPERFEASKTIDQLVEVFMNGAGTESSTTHEHRTTRQR